MTESGGIRFDADDLRRTVAKVLDVEPAELTDDVRFVEDLGGNSLLALEVLVVLEEKYGVTFTRDEVDSLTSLPRTRDLLAAAMLHLPVVRLVVRADFEDDADHAAHGARRRPPFCSQACAMTDRIGGGVDPVPHLADRLTEPADLARSPFYQYAFTLIP